MLHTGYVSQELGRVWDCNQVMDSENLCISYNITIDHSWVWQHRISLSFEKDNGRLDTKREWRDSRMMTTEGVDEVFHSMTVYGLCNLQEWFCEASRWVASTSQVSWRIALKTYASCSRTNRLKSTISSEYVWHPDALIMSLSGLSTSTLRASSDFHQWVIFNFKYCFLSQYQYSWRSISSETSRKDRYQSLLRR